jgi:hypothetical protein
MTSPIMKLIVVIPIILFLAVNVYSASRFPINSTSVWRVDHIRNGVSNEEKHEVGDDISKYFIKGDTVINSKHYFKLFKTGTSYFDEPFYYENVYQGALRDEDNKFYFITKKESTEVLLYNFNAVVDDTIQVPYEGAFETKVVSSIDTLYDGRRMIHFNPKEPIIGCGDQYFIEGIGGSGGLLEGPACNHFWTSDNHLVCFVQDNLLIYHDNNFQFNCDVIKPATSYLDSTCVWRVDKQYENAKEADFEKLIYFIHGDTLIGGSTYFKLFKTGYQLMIPNNHNYFSGYNDSVYMGALREKNNGFYFIEKNNFTEKLLYNFDLKAGDMVDGSICKGDTVKKVETVIDNRKVIYLSDNYWEKNIIQGIGSDKGLLEGKDENSLLVCFMKNNSSVYHNGSGAECLLNYDELSFYYSDRMDVLPANPIEKENVQLNVRFCYPVSADNPQIPVLSNSDYEVVDNAINLTLTYDYNDQNNLSDTKILIPIYYTLPIGSFTEGYYYVDLAVNTHHKGSTEEYTVERDKSLYVSFEVTKTNAIVTPIVQHDIKVYPVASDHLIIVENPNRDVSINTISIFTITGENVKRINISDYSNQQSIQIDGDFLKKGVYLVHLEGNGLNLMKKIIIK